VEIVVNLNESDSGWFASATVAQILVAVTTLILAGFTWRSVRAASRSADATVELAQAAESEVAALHTQNELAEKTLLASIQPVLSDFPQGSRTELDSADELERLKASMSRGSYYPIPSRPNDLPGDWVPWAAPEDERIARLQGFHILSDTMVQQAPEHITGWGVTTLFKNVGNGAAIIERATLELAGTSAACQTRISKLAIARDDYCRVTFNVLATHFPDPLKSGGYGRNYAKPDFFIDISYSNVAGTGRLRTRQQIQIVRQAPHIAALEIWDSQTGEQLAVSEYMA
jgi:hypothetical protein